jgi:hypothetical protein
MPVPRVYRALPNLVGGSEFGVFNNTLRNACIALTERYLNLKVDGVLTKPILPDKEFYKLIMLDDFRNGLIKKVKHYAHVYSRSDVVEMYTGQKRRIYQAAMESLMVDPLVKVDSHLKTFIKFEKTNINKAPRIINPRSTRYTLELARYLKKLEKPVYAAINRLFKSRAKATVIKGFNVYETADVIRTKWDQFVDPVSVAGDITKLDMHISIDALKFEHSVYNGIFKSRKLKRLLSWQLLNKGRAYFKDGHVSFFMRGTRSSGDINTSLGNVIIVCAVIYSFMRTFGVKMELCNNGDDFSIILERSQLHILDKLPMWFELAGFVLKMETPVDAFEQIEFCQTQPVFDGKQWRMVRNPFTCFRKDTICTMPVMVSSQYEMWLKAVGDGNGVLTVGLPIFQSMYAAFRRSGKQYSAEFYQRVYKNTSMFERTHGIEEATLTPVSQDARYSFYVAFGILPDLQRCVEAYFDKLHITSEETERLDTIIGDDLLNNEVFPINVSW